MILILAGEHPCNCFAFLWQLHTFWVENDNYFTVTKPWFASRIPFPLSLILPGRMSRGALNRILLTRGEPPLYHIQEVEAQVQESPSKPSREGRREGTGPYLEMLPPKSPSSFLDIQRCQGVPQPPVKQIGNISVLLW